MSKLDDDKLDRRIAQYLSWHPGAQNPAEYLFYFGEVGLLEILSQTSKDKYVIFTTYDNSVDRCTFKYKDA